MNRGVCNGTVAAVCVLAMCVLAPGASARHRGRTIQRLDSLRVSLPPLKVDTTAFLPEEDEWGAPVMLSMGVDSAGASYARGRGLTGKIVFIAALLGTNGRTGRCVVTRSVPQLDSIAVATVKRSRWRPARGNGHTPIEVWIQVPIKF